MATIDVLPHNERAGTWILVWKERQESVGRVSQLNDGSCVVKPQGPHWSPMKSFAGNKFLTLQEALDEVRIYFEHR